MAAGEARGRGSSRCTGPTSWTAPDQAPVSVPAASLRQAMPHNKTLVRRSERLMLSCKGALCSRPDKRLPKITLQAVWQACDRHCLS